MELKYKFRKTDGVRSTELLFTAYTKYYLQYFTILSSVIVNYNNLKKEKIYIRLNSDYDEAFTVLREGILEKATFYSHKIFKITIVTAYECKTVKNVHIFTFVCKKTK